MVNYLIFCCLLIVVLLLAAEACHRTDDGIQSYKSCVPNFAEKQINLVHSHDRIISEFECDRDYHGLYPV